MTNWPPDEQITPHFRLYEFGCRCGRCLGFPDDLDEIRETAEFAERIREALGNLPVRISSGFRCKAHNAEVGGASNSLHLEGKAIDFGVKTLSPRTVQAILSKRRDLVKGLGKYPGWTHADRRDGPPATWRG